MTADLSHSDAPLGPLFSTSITRLLAAVPGEMRAVLKSLTGEPVMPIDELREELREYMLGVERCAEEVEFFDCETARRVGEKCETLLDALDSGGSEEHRCLIQLAVRYFIVADDAQSDTMSPIGFDDDEQVVDLVIEELRKDGLSIE